MKSLTDLFSKSRANDAIELEALFGDRAQHVVHPDRPGDRSPDDRTIVANVGEKPWRPICCLSLVFANGARDENVVGTGILIAPNVILTAAHNLFSPRTRRFVKTAHAHVGTNSGAHAASARIRRVEICPGYSDFADTDIRRYRYDFGVAKVESNALIDWSGEFLDVANQPPLADDELGRARLNVAGYPAEQGPPKLKSDSGGVLRDTISPANFRYRMDTTAGQSGGPVFRYMADSQQVTYAGVHVGGDSRGNIARRFDAAMQNRVKEWLQGFQA